LNHIPAERAHQPDRAVKPGNRQTADARGAAIHHKTLLQRTQAEAGVFDLNQNHGVIADSDPAPEAFVFVTVKSAAIPGTVKIAAVKPAKRKTRSCFIGRWG